MNNTFVIVTWNSQGQILELLDSIKRYEPESAIVIVDNASQDETVKLIKSHHYRGLILHVCRTNLGFAKANNLALGYVQTKYVSFINPDTRLHQPVIAHLQNELQPPVGLIGVKLIDQNGSLQPSMYAFQRPLTILVEQFDLGRILPTKIAAKLSPENTSHQSKTFADWLVGAFLFTSVADYRLIGGFSEDYFLYSEDMDIAYKYHQNGFKVLFDPSLSILHIGGQSEGQTKSGKNLKLLRSFCIFASKYGLKHNISTLLFSYRLKAVIFAHIDHKRAQRYRENVKYLRSQLK